ncbi:MAG TPA: SDR family oxidoreductase [Opitutaceae bacterium]|nr:SDR family oxidoreductase [Opitutaceae bacterium]
MKTFSLAGSGALVTGSSRGIGLAIANRLMEMGARVVFHGHTPRPQEIASSVPYLQSNFLDEDAPGQTIASAFEADEQLNLLVCNAGSFFDVPYLEMTAAEWEKTITLNVRAVYFLVQAFAKEMVARKRGGSIVIISSTNGFQSEDFSTAYDTSKGALVMMTRTLAHSLAVHHIRVNGVAPGLIYTPLSAAYLDAQPARRRHYEKKILVGRIGRAEDCAGPVAFLLSPASEYITGQTLIVDGGLTTSQIGAL